MLLHEWPRVDDDGLRRARLQQDPRVRAVQRHRSGVRREDTVCTGRDRAPDHGAVTDGGGLVTVHEYAVRLTSAGAGEAQALGRHADATRRQAGRKSRGRAARDRPPREPPQGASSCRLWRTARPVARAPAPWRWSRCRATAAIAQRSERRWRRHSGSSAGPPAGVVRVVHPRRDIRVALEAGLVERAARGRYVVTTASEQRRRAAAAVRRSRI